jgi:hypothetical protein
MRKFNILAAVAATLALGSIASAKDKPEAPKEKKICRYEMDSTSRIGGRRICQTREETAGETERRQRDAEQAVAAANRGR